MVAAFARWGFSVNPLMVRVRQRRGADRPLSRLIEAERAELPYDIDGVVYKVDDLELQRRLGLCLAQSALGDCPQVSRRKGLDTAHGHRHPGRSHRRDDPVARLEPVTVGGVVVTNATLHNAEEIERLGVRIGDTVHRSSAPAMSSRRCLASWSLRPEDAVAFAFPTICPCSLKTPVIREETAGGEEGVVRRCSGEFACPFQRKEHLKHFVSRKAFDIEGLGDKQIEYFYEDEGPADQPPADIFTLSRCDEANGLPS
jgi:DNA ligase (NAD+)